MSASKQSINQMQMQDHGHVAWSQLSLLFRLPCRSLVLYVLAPCRCRKGSFIGATLLVTIMCHVFFFLFFFKEEALHVSQICHRSDISGQLKETSGMKAYTAQPTTGEAAMPCAMAKYPPCDLMRCRSNCSLGSGLSLPSGCQARQIGMDAVNDM